MTRIECTALARINGEKGNTWTVGGLPRHRARTIKEDALTAVWSSSASAVMSIAFRRVGKYVAVIKFDSKGLGRRPQNLVALRLEVVGGVKIEFDRSNNT